VAIALRLGLSFVPDGKVAVYRMMPARFDLLAAGALLALASRRGALHARGDRPWLFVGAASLGAFVMLALTVPAFRAATNSALFNVVGFALILGVCVAVVALTINGTFRPLLYLLDLAPLRFIGTISYVCYLVHDFIRYLLDVHAPGLHGLPRMAVGFGATIAVGALSFYLMEDPLRRRFRDLVRPAKRPAAEPSPVAAGLGAGA
jgi:peptidoglycan/LPS O-acetylase OafA/YrhL